MVDVPSNTTTTAVLETVNLPGLPTAAGSYSGQIETFGDHDWIRVSLAAGFQYQFFLSVQAAGSQTGDSFLSLLDGTGALLVGSGGSGVNALVTYTPTTSGTFYLDVWEFGGDARGAYSVFATAAVATNAPQTGGDDAVIAGIDERLLGRAGDDTLSLGPSGNDALGEQGDDLLIGNDKDNILSGGLGNDTAFGVGGSDFIFGDAGDDWLNGDAGADRIFGGNGFDDLYGGGDGDSLSGGADDDYLDGGDGTDTLNGGTGNDTLRGGSGNDVLTGGLGRDVLFGDANADRFDFNSLSESPRGANRDNISQFTHGDDDIDLRTIDAKTGVAGNQAFKFIGKQGFHDVKGELRYIDKGASCIVQGDVNGDGKADFEIWVGVGALNKGDFLL